MKRTFGQVTVDSNVILHLIGADGSAYPRDLEIMKRCIPIMTIPYVVDREVSYKMDPLRKEMYERYFGRASVAKVPTDGSALKKVEEYQLGLARHPWSAAAEEWMRKKSPQMPADRKERKRLLRLLYESSERDRAIFAQAASLAGSKSTVLISDDYDIHMLKPLCPGSLGIARICQIPKLKLDLR